MGLHSPSARVSGSLTSTLVMTRAPLHTFRFLGTEPYGERRTMYPGLKCHCSGKSPAVRRPVDVRRPRALDAAAMNACADRRRKNKSSSVRLAILAAASRVCCAALRELPWQSKASRKRKGSKQSSDSNNCQRDKYCDGDGPRDLEGETTKRDGVNLATTSLFLVQVDCPQAHFSNHRILLKRNSGDSRRCCAPE